MNAEFHKMVTDHYDRVFAVANALTQNSSDAQDLTQETFLNAFRSYDNFDGQSSVRTWLIAILKNRFRLYQREKGRFRRAHSRAHTAAPEQADEKLDKLKSALARLEEDDRLIVVLYHLDGLSYEEIAAVMECPLGTVKSRLFAARQKLKELVACPTASGRRGG